MVPCKPSCSTESNVQGKAKGRGITAIPREKLEPAHFFEYIMIKKYNTDSPMDAKG